MPAPTDLSGVLKNVKLDEKVNFTLHPDGMNNTVTAISLIG